MIETQDLTKTFGDTTAVDHVTLSIAAGELFGLLGPNGSGKTTMNKLLTGQIRPDAGTVRVMGLDVPADPVRVRAGIGIIPEQETPPSFLTAEEYLHFVGRVRGITAIDEQAEKWFDILEFRDKRQVLCKDLSRGTRQKLMVAQAFLHEPPLAFIDEPLINLDPIMQRTVKDFLSEYVAGGGTVFFSTHILGIAEEICTSFAILHNGVVLHHGTIDELVTGDRHLEGFFLERVRGHAHA
ncbi:MAG: ABC transporter ATP-binding protein [Methanomicrobiales archaeon]|nr:ABC transporter ATP-binding protein [Methanomicrobiales archaeon]